MDVDGVLTDGTLFVGESGEAFKSFNVRDGLAVTLLRSHGVRSGVLSGKSSAGLNFRVQELGLNVAVSGTLAKRKAYEEIKESEGLEDEEVAYIGDDVIDISLAGVVGSFYAPSDAHPLVLRRADFVLPCVGGAGVARCAAEHLLSLGGLSVDQMYEPMFKKDGSIDGTQ